MNKPTLLLCLVASPAFAAEPPDWYAHIPAAQRAALLATRHAVPPHTLIASGSVQGWRGPASAAYSAPATFDASALVHPPQHSTLYWLVMQDRERALLRAYRTPAVEFGHWRRVGQRDRL